jgi:hypothetical protein
MHSSFSFCSFSAQPCGQPLAAALSCAEYLISPTSRYSYRIRILSAKENIIMTQKLSRPAPAYHRQCIALERRMVRAYHHGLMGLYCQSTTGLRRVKPMVLLSFPNSHQFRQSVPVPEVYGRSNSHGSFVTLANKPHSPQALSEKHLSLHGIDRRLCQAWAILPSLENCKGSLE